MGREVMYMYVRGIDVAIGFFSHFLEGFGTILTLRYFFHFCGVQCISVLEKYILPVSSISYWNLELF